MVGILLILIAGVALALLPHMNSTPNARGFQVLFQVMAAVYLAIGAILAVAGINLLRLRAWACALIQTLCWLGLILASMAVFGLLLLLFTHPPEIQVGAMEVKDLIVTVIFAILMWLIRRYLRSPAVREAIAARQSGAKANP